MPLLGSLKAFSCIRSPSFAAEVVGSAAKDREPPNMEAVTVLARPDTTIIRKTVCRKGSSGSARPHTHNYQSIAAVLNCHSIRQHVH